MKRIVALLICIAMIFAMGGCTKVTTKYIQRLDNNVSSDSNTGTEEPDKKPDPEEDKKPDPEEDDKQDNETSKDDVEKADEIVDLVEKDSAIFNGNYPDENNYKTYYVDSENGNDDNNGRSPKNAWQTLNNVNTTNFEPGTKIMLKRGSVFNQQLIPTSSGKPGKYIIIDAYGSGKKPLINGDGEAAAVLISNLEYIEVRNLEITNKSAYGGDLNGVLVKTGGNISSTEMYEGGRRNHIYLINLDIHDITCTEGKRFHAGIVFSSNLAKSPTAFNNVLVQGCTIKNTGGSGITMSSDYANAPGVEWSPAEFFPSTNVCFRGNYIENCASDGIFQSCGDKVLMEHNVVTNTSYAQGAYAGMWPHCSRNVVMQYNEVYGIKLVGGDGQGFDVDIACINTVVQYNYSHDNEGGFILICTDGSSGHGFNRDVTVRYNISQNDLSQIFTLSGPISDVKIYNNTVYVKEGLKTNLVGSYDWGAGFSPEGVRFTNNLFYMNSKGGNSLIIPSRLVFDSNLFWGSYNYSNLPAVNTINADPMLKAPGTAGLGFDTLTGYSLLQGSPCINAGILLGNNGGKDFFGNKLPSSGNVTIGAAEFFK